MKKYLTIFKTSFKQELDSITDTIIGSLFFVIIMYILVQLWQYIYGGSGAGTVINGYNINQMVWYLVIGEALVTCAKGRRVTVSTSNEIKSGSIAYKLNKPYNYYLYNVTSFTAQSFFKMLILSPVIVAVGLVFVGVPTNFTWGQILPCILTIMLSSFLIMCMYSVVGLLAFWVQEATPFAWILAKVLMLLGMFFPLEFFPKWLQPVILYSPIYSVQSGPASLVANFSWELFAKVAISQAVWCVIILAIGLGVYNLGKRRVISNGG